MHVALLAAGQLHDAIGAQPWIRDAERVLALDGGLVHAAALGVRPELLIGDLDSLPAAARADYDGPIEQHPVMKDETDSELGVQRAIALGAKRITLVGGIGSRFDHSLANIAMMMRLTQRDIECRITDGLTTLFPIADAWSGQAPSGTLLSLLAWEKAAHDLCLRGLLYSVEHIDLEPGSTRGISNAFTGQQATITVGHGLLLAMIVDASLA